jgi:hypothetical protein
MLLVLTLTTPDSSSDELILKSTICTIVMAAFATESRDGNCRIRAEGTIEKADMAYIKTFCFQYV